MTRNFRLTLMYDGTSFCGWQRQKQQTTVCGELERAISVITRQNVSVTGVSRTDAGVHAKSYTANVFLDTDTDAGILLKGINALLPEGIALCSIDLCDDNFNARFDVKNKTYIYKIDNSIYGNVFEKRYAWHYKFSLDISKMQQAAQYFVGTHDFSAFMAQGGTAKTFTRSIYTCFVTKEDDIIKIFIKGDGFLYNMVRIIAGTLVWVGKGSICAEQIPSIISSKERKNAGITAPAKGLTLYEMEY